MWYVIQVPTGQEEQIIEEAKKYEVTEFLTELFTPRWENQKKIQGEWKELTGVIFPGYLFVITETPEAWYQTLKRIPRLTKLLGTGEKWTPLLEEDIFLLELLSGRERILRMSRGYQKDGRIYVTEGPLKGLEHLICRADRHKRIAWLKVKLLGEARRLKAGLEIVRKIEKKEESTCI